MKTNILKDTSIKGILVYPTVLIEKLNEATSIVEKNIGIDYKDIIRIFRPKKISFPENWVRIDVLYNGVVKDFYENKSINEMIRLCDSRGVIIMQKIKSSLAINLHKVVGLTKYSKITVEGIDTPLDVSKYFQPKLKVALAKVWDD